MNQRFLKGLTMPFLMLVFALVLASCGEDDGADLPEINAGNVTLTENATLGNILTDGNGVTLYFFSNDADGQSACSGGCLDAWPVFYAADLQVGAGLDINDFDVITGTDGNNQTTYKGWPLYYFAPNGDAVIEAAGATAGEGVGNVWFVAKPDYTVMLASGQLTGLDDVNYTGDYEPGEGQTSYFVDAEGNTIYIFTPDFNGVNTFTAEDFSNNSVWPIYETTLDQIPSTLNRGDFATITVGDRTQLTYKGWPLYFFGNDQGRGETKGVSVPAPGVWPVATGSLETALSPDVQLKEVGDVGTVMTDAQGRTLYFFTRDVNGESACAGGCLDAWPTFYEADLSVGNGLDASLFGTITGTDGSLQTTYKGWPLYYYAPAGDGVIEEAGQAQGEGVGSVWYVAKADYDLMIADAQLVGADGESYLSDYSVGAGITKYFTNAEGRTIYIFVNDSRDTNNFTAEDFSNDGVWPIFFTEIENLPSGINKDDFGVIDVFGRQQLTFKGWPLYYFGSDENRGDNKGVSVPNPGIWPVINNDLAAAE